MKLLQFLFRVTAIATSSHMNWISHVGTPLSGDNLARLNCILYANTRTWYLCTRGHSHLLQGMSFAKCYGHWERLLAIDARVSNRRSHGKGYGLRIGT